jgi:hypothetical protein
MLFSVKLFRSNGFVGEPLFVGIDQFFFSELNRFHRDRRNRTGRIFVHILMLEEGWIVEIPMLSIRKSTSHHFHQLPLSQALLAIDETALLATIPVLELPCRDFETEVFPANGKINKYGFLGFRNSWLEERRRYPSANNTNSERHSG